MLSRGTVGWSVYHSEPKRPSSSPACQTKRMERFGLVRAVAKARAAVEGLPEGELRDALEALGRAVLAARGG